MGMLRHTPSSRGRKGLTCTCRELSLPGWRACSSFLLPIQGPCILGDPAQEMQGETQGPSDPSQYHQEADSGSWERLPSWPTWRLMGQDGVGLGSAEWRDT